MKKVLFLMESLECGGAERVLVNLVNKMDKGKYDITVATLFADGVNCDSLHPDIRYLSLGKRKFPGITRLMYVIPKRVLFNYYFKTCDFDVVIAYMTGTPTLIAAGAPTKKIAWIHSVFYPVGKLDLKYHFLEKAYRKYNAVAGVSKMACDSFKDLIKTEIEPRVIYNTNNIDQIRKRAKEKTVQKKSEMEIVSVGCLESSKGYDRLITACRQLISEGYQFHLSIIGEGEEHEKLQHMIHDFGLNKVIDLAGFQSNPYPYMYCADFFISSSRVEGLSTVVTEALVLGKPVIATDISGTRELLGDKSEYGMIVEDSEKGILGGMKRFLQESELLEYYSKQAKIRAKRFNSERTVKEVENLIEEVINK